jgi:anthranilate synthase component 2
LPVHGVQFHPESIASEHGHMMLKNFLEIAAAWNAATGRRKEAPAIAPSARPKARASVN